MATTSWNGRRGPLSLPASPAAAARAAEREFALVFKVLNNAFSPPIDAGCQAAAAKLGDVTCTYIGPTEYDEAKQVQLAQDMITRGVDGLGISAGNPKAMARIMKMAKDKGIPVVTFDTDVLPEDAGLRAHLYRHRQLRVRRRAGGEGARVQARRAAPSASSPAPPPPKTSRRASRASATRWPARRRTSRSTR